MIRILSFGLAPVTAVACRMFRGMARAILAAAGGPVTPAEPGAAVTLEQFDGGSWTTVATAITDGAGAFGTAFTPNGSGSVRTRLDDGGALSPQRALAVVPAVALTLGRGKAFLGARLRADVHPTTYAGHVRISVRAGTHVLARKSASVVDGRLATRVPTPWAGAVNVRIQLPSSGALVAGPSHGGSRS